MEKIIQKMWAWLNKIWNTRKINDPETLQKSNSFCIMPWVHVHITQYGTVTPCCQAPWQEEQAFGNINKEDMMEIWNGDKMNAFRKGMLDNKADTRCESCFVKERAGFTSLRNITNHKFKHKEALALSTQANGAIPGVKPVYFDIRFSNVCNLKCRICGPWSSSSWYNDAISLGMLNAESKAITRSFENTEAFFGQFVQVIDVLEELYFAGGEPLVIDEHYRVLELLIAHGKTDVRLTYNSNFSSFKYKNHDIVSLWKQFPNISIAASLDASGERGEFLRKNLKWTDVLENRKTLIRDLPHIEFIVSPTLNIYNLIHLPDFHVDWVKNGLIQVEDFIPTLLVKPKELSIAILPDEFKRKAVARYEEHLAWIRAFVFDKKEKGEHMLKQFENIITCLNDPASKETTMEMFWKSSEGLDSLRLEKTLEVFPELKELSMAFSR